MSKFEDRGKQFLQLRELVGDVESDEYYKSDGYLLRWLQFTNYDVKKAAIAFRKCMEWRMENRIDSILDEDFSELAAKFPIDLSDVDKHNRLVVKIFIEAFNCKSLDFHGERDRYIRFAYWTCERIERRLREQFDKTEGTVSQYAVVVDCTKMSDHMKEVGMRRLYAVIMLLKEVVSKLANNFPRGAQVTYVVKASKLFTVFYSAVKHLSCKATVDALQMHGTDSTFDWKKEIFEKEMITNGQ